MTFYEKHIFFCTNRRDGGRACCADHDALELRQYMKDKLKSLSLHGAGQFRVNSAGCMDRCQEGPVIVIYPDSVWYTYETKDDVDEIIQSHLLDGKVVDRLLI